MSQVASRFILVSLFVAVAASASSSQSPAQLKSPVTATIASTRQAVGPAEAFPIKITIANEGRQAITFERGDVLSSESVVAATYERKGKWAMVHDQPQSGAVELRPGESFTIPASITLPEALTKTPTALSLQWVGQRTLAGVRSNEVNISIREDKNPTISLATSEGTIVLELWPEKAPNHVANMIALAKSGFYDGRLFHRVIQNFMVQTGCPLGNGTGDPGYKIAAEFNDAPFGKGVLGMARGPDNDSAGSQFFICVADSPEVKGLDHKYTAFGKVIEGQDIADKISMVPRDTQKGDRPFKDVTLTKATITLPASYTLPDVKKVGEKAAPKPESRSENK